MTRWKSSDIAGAIAGGRLLELRKAPKGTPQPTQLAFGRSLRIALAMKGGISLAVWIGGAAAELDVLRRIRILGSRGAERAYLLTDPSGATGDLVVERARIYADALISRGYDQIEFDVLAGASAGGLNGVLYGVSQRQGVAIDALMDVWMESGDIWNLLREPGFGGVESALTGDGYFWPAVQNAIETLYGTPGNEDHRAPRIVVDLSTTVVDHDDIRRLGTHERSGHFHFVGENPADATQPGAEKGRAIPWRPQPVLSPTDSESTAEAEVTDADLAWKSDVARLAYAARSTSSFPAAFEPALIWSPNSLDDSTLASATELDMRFAFHLQRGREEEPPRPFRVIDGGVTDNVPIDRAYRAVRDMPADRFGDRAVLYLEPDPKTLGRNLTPSGTVPPPNPERPTERRRDAVSGFIRTIRAGISGRGIHESADDEIDEIEEYRRQLFLEQGRDESYAVTADAAEGDYDRNAARQAYVRYRSTSDLGTLNRVLCNPSFWQLGSDLPTRVPREPAPGGFMAGLDRALIASYQDAAALADPRHLAITQGSQALVDATRSAIAWVRKLESIAFDHHAELSDLGPRFSTLRDTLIPIALFARVARDQRLDRLQLAIMGAASSLEPAEYDAQLVVDTWLDAEGTTNAGELDVAGQWDEMNDCVSQLRSITKAIRKKAAALELADPPAVGLRDDLDQTPWSSVPAVDRAFEGWDLAPFAAARGIPEPISAIRFAKITGAEHPAASLKFRALREAQLSGVVSGWLKLDDDEFDAAALQVNVPDQLDANSKLAGSALANFGAFLSRDWRRNDWWWGRMDAAAGMLRFLDTLRSPDGRPFDLDEAIEATQSAVLKQGGDAIAPLATDLNDPISIANGMSAGSHALANLRPGYLVAVASRTVRVVGRSAARRIGFKQFLARVLLPPLLVAAPIIAHPIRALVALAVVFASLAAASSQVYGLGRLFHAPGITVPEPTAEELAHPWFREWSFLFWLVLIVLALVALALVAEAAWRRSREQWAKLDRPLPAADPAHPLVEHTGSSERLSSVLTDRRNRARRSARWGIVGGAAATLAAVVFVIADHGLSIRVWALIAAAIGCGLYVRSRASALPDAPRFTSSRRFWVGAFIVATVLALVPEYTRMATVWIESVAVDPWLPSSVDTLHQSVTLALCAALLAVVLGWGWLGATAHKRGRLAILWIVAVAILSATAVFVVAGLVEATFPADNSVVTKGVAVTITAWFAASWAFWYLGEIKVYLAYPASDSAEFATPVS